MPIPKIIHQIAPKDKSKWYPLWVKCQESWLTHFKDFEYKLWNDEEDIDNLVKNNFPNYWDIYQNFPIHIMKIDFARLCMLDLYGGIYADMDVFCYQNFYNDLEQDCVHLLQAPYGQTRVNGDNLIENALMVSPDTHEFFKLCMKNCKNIFESQIIKQEFIFPLSFFHQILVCNTAGPALVSNTFSEYNKNVKILDGLIFNNHGLSYDKSYKTKHLLTGCWGKEVLENISKDHYFEEVKCFFNKSCYTEKVQDDTFDFYKDYTNGNYLKSFKFDYSKNFSKNNLLTNSFLYD